MFPQQNGYMFSCIWANTTLRIFQIVEVASKLGPALQVGENLVWRKPGPSKSKEPEADHPPPASAPDGSYV